MLRSMGFEGMVVNRVHEATKNRMRDEGKLEFWWRQEWDVDGGSHANQGPGSTGIFTHMFPTMYYDIPNTCGDWSHESWDICAQFDFERPQSKVITSSIGQPPSTMSNTEMRYMMMKFASVAARTALMISRGNRIRFSSEPPHWSLRWLVRGARNWLIK